jgi:hypothetical protein
MKKITLGLLSASLLSTAAFAQQAANTAPLTNAEIARLKAKLESSLSANLNKQIGAPGTSFGAPTAYGAAGGQAFVGGSLVHDLKGKNLPDGNGKTDGSLAAGIGFGNPLNAVGVELVGNLTSVDPRNGGFGDSGTIGLKVHRVLDAGSSTSVGFALSDAVRWGDPKKSARSNYLAISGNLPVQLVGKYPLAATFGLGNGSYRPFGSVSNKVGAFFSVGSQLTERTSLSLSNVGGKTNVGLGLTPFNAPISLSVGINDVGNRSTVGRTFAVNAGYAFTY